MVQTEGAGLPGASLKKRMTFCLKVFANTGGLACVECCEWFSATCDVTYLRKHQLACCPEGEPEEYSVAIAKARTAAVAAPKIPRCKPAAPAAAEEAPEHKKPKLAAPKLAAPAAAAPAPAAAAPAAPAPAAGKKRKEAPAAAAPAAAAAADEPCVPPRPFPPRPFPPPPPRAPYTAALPPPPAPSHHM